MPKQKTKIQVFFYSLIFVAVWLLLGHVKASAATLNVPSQYGSIQAGVNAASNGDTVLVGAGTYREQVIINGKYIELKSSSGANSTVISAGPGKSSILITNVPHVSGAPRTKVDGFKITGGYSPDGQGGGITIYNNADPLVQNCIISENHATTHGGGISIYNNSNPTIKSNVINNNSAAIFGGGIFVVYGSSPVIYGNTITNNDATGTTFPGGGSSGGGLYLENYVTNPSAKSSPVVMKNTIQGNTADFAGGGISMRVGVNTILEENTFKSNSAVYGGGVHIEVEGASPVVYNNTIRENTASYSATFSGSGYGGGISIYASSKARVYNNQIFSNAASRGGGGIVMSESSNSTISGNNIYSNYVADAGYYEGGCIYIANATANIFNNVIRNCTANLGGGVAILDNAQVTLTNNTIVKNNATYASAPAAGGGIFVRDSNGITATIKNNIIALNQDRQIFEEREEATYTNNFISNDGDGIYFSYDAGGLSDIGSFNGNGSINSPTGNLDGTPGFVDEANHDYNLTAGATARDTATATGAPSEDLRKAIRPENGSYDIGAYEYTTETVFKSPVFRFWGSEYNGHFYTGSTSERNTVISSYPAKTWQYEFTAYDAFPSAVTNSTPMYRFWSNAYKAHFYTATTGERDYVIANYPTIWSYEGPVYEVYPLSYSGGGTNDVFRFWSPSYFNHFYTANSAEKDYIIANYPANIWSHENARFKVPR